MAMNPFAYLQRVDSRVVAPDIIADLHVHIMNAQK